MTYTKHENTYLQAVPYYSLTTEDLWIAIVAYN